jgi:hypothetical protein
LPTPGHSTATEVFPMRNVQLDPLKINARPSQP